jgi:hypothetical protein
MTQSDFTQMYSEDLLDAVKLCNAALAKDSPEMPKIYIVQIMNMLFAYLSNNQRKEIERYLAEKDYLPPLKLIDPNEMKATVAASDLLKGL